MQFLCRIAVWSIVIGVFIKCATTIKSYRKEIRGYQNKCKNDKTPFHAIRTENLNKKIMKIRVFVFIIGMGIVLYHSGLVQMTQKKVDIVVKNRTVLSFFNGDRYLNPLKYAEDAVIVKEKPEEEIVMELMDKLHFSDYKNNYDLNYITEDMINHYTDRIKEFLAPPITQEDKPLSHQQKMQTAVDAETRTKVTNDVQDYKLELMDADKAIESFRDCLSYTDLEHETSPDIQTRIGIIYYFLFVNLESLDQFNKEYRNHLLLCALACFKIANDSSKKDEENYWLQTYYYIGECELQVGSRMEDKNIRTDLFKDAMEKIEYVIERPEDIDEVLYAAAKKDYATLKVYIND